MNDVHSYKFVLKRFIIIKNIKCYHFKVPPAKNMGSLYKIVLTSNLNFDARLLFYKLLCVGSADY